MSILLGLFITLFGGAPQAAAGAEADTSAVEVDEWTVPYESSRPRDPYVGPDGRVWFVGQRSDYVASFDPGSGEFERYDLEPGTAPHTCIVGDDGTVWIAGNGSAYIGKLDPATGVIEKIEMPDPRATDPHTMAFTSEGDIWFTLQVSNRIGFLDTESEEVQIVPVETGGARPYGLKVDENDRPWIVLFGTNKLATVDPASMQIEEISLPREGAHPRRIDLTSDGGVWYVDYEEGYLGRYDPATGTFEEWAMPGGRDAQPYAMAADNQDRIWFVETGPSPNRFVGFDPATETFLPASDIPSGGGAVRHMYFHEPTGSVWFGADTNTIGRAQVIPGI
jgi:virginiamycin B lyase